MGSTQKTQQLVRAVALILTISSNPCLSAVPLSPEVRYVGGGEAVRERFRTNGNEPLDTETRPIPFPFRAEALKWSRGYWTNKRNAYLNETFLVPGGSDANYKDSTTFLSRRLMRNASTIPGKMGFLNNRGYNRWICYVLWNGVEIETRGIGSYEILERVPERNYTWAGSSNGDILDGAVIGGMMSWTFELVFICRINFKFKKVKHVVTGMLLPRSGQGKCFVPWRGKNMSNVVYELLQDVTCPGDEEDDFQCTSRHDCSTAEFSCLGGVRRCVVKEYQRDGVEDCSDGSDEFPEPTTTTTTPTTTTTTPTTTTTTPSTTTPITSTTPTTTTTTPSTTTPITSTTPTTTTTTTSTTTTTPITSTTPTTTTTTTSTTTTTPITSTTPKYVPCTENEFRCALDHCILKIQTCDGYQDCLFGQDETLESCKIQEKCEGRFSCGNGTCIPLTYKCDGQRDCDNGKDEIDKDCRIPQYYCSSRHFECNDGSCIARKFKCDNNTDCKDASDEVNCPSPTSSTTKAPDIQNASSTTTGEGEEEEEEAISQKTVLPHQVESLSWNKGLWLRRDDNLPTYTFRDESILDSEKVQTYICRVKLNPTEIILGKSIVNENSHTKAVKTTFICSYVLKTNYRKITLQPEIPFEMFVDGNSGQEEGSPNWTWTNSSSGYILNGATIAGLAPNSYELMFICRLYIHYVSRSERLDGKLIKRVNVAFWSVGVLQPKVGNCVVPVSDYKPELLTSYQVLQDLRFE